MTSAVDPQRSPPIDTPIGGLSLAVEPTWVQRRRVNNTWKIDQVPPSEWPYHKERDCFPSLPLQPPRFHFWESYHEIQNPCSLRLYRPGVGVTSVALIWNMNIILCVCFKAICAWRVHVNRLYLGGCWLFACAMTNVPRSRNAIFTQYSDQEKGKGDLKPTHHPPKAMNCELLKKFSMNCCRFLFFALCSVRCLPFASFYQ